MCFGGQGGAGRAKDKAVLAGRFRQEMTVHIRLCGPDPFMTRLCVAAVQNAKKAGFLSFSSLFSLFRLTLGFFRVKMMPEIGQNIRIVD
jgi:hypothetical protein